MPTPGDPSFDRERRRARARQAAAEAAPERLAELRSRYLTPTTRVARVKPVGERSVPKRGGAPALIDSAAIAAVARSALDQHPATWTSYAELCSASGLDRGLALVVARALIPEPTGDHWFRIRNSEGVYNVPTDEAEHGGPVRFSQAEADRRLAATGVAIVAKRADPARKLCWTTSGWVVQG